MLSQSNRPERSEGMFGVFRDPQTYKNLGYLLLSFPLCIFYFVFIVTGLALSIGLMPLFLAGVPLLLGVLFIARQLMKFEAMLAGKVLDDEPLLPEPARSAHGLFRRLGASLADPYTYKSIVYMLLKFPIGIVGFVLAVIAVSGALAGLASPIVWIVLKQTIDVDIYDDPDNHTIWELLGFGLDSSETAILNIVLGIALSWVFMHISNWFAWLHAKFAMFMCEDL